MQICILDEPSNFLDREALGGLAVAIREWAGAVVSRVPFNVFDRSSQVGCCKGDNFPQQRIRVSTMYVII
jgi:hypothetical protein